MFPNGSQFNLHFRFATHHRAKCDGDMSFAAEAFKSALQHSGLGYRDFAKKARLSSGTLGKFVGGRPPSPELLKKLCNSWPHPEAGVAILAAHLRDEVNRAGIAQGRIEVEVPKIPGDTELAIAIQRLRQRATADPAMRSVVLGLAQTLTATPAVFVDVEKWGKIGPKTADVLRRMGKTESAREIAREDRK